MKGKELAEQIQGAAQQDGVPACIFGGNEGGRFFQGEAQALGWLRDGWPATFGKELCELFAVHGPLVVLNRRDEQRCVPGDAADKRQHVGYILVRKAGEDDGGGLDARVTDSRFKRAQAVGVVRAVKEQGRQAVGGRPGKCAEASPLATVSGILGQCR